MFLAAIMGYGMAGLRRGPPILTEREKKSRKCLLPSCAALTTHNGGYCCAEHCKQHRADTSNEMVDADVLPEKYQMKAARLLSQIQKTARKPTGRKG
jgi:hypothetical protein